MSNVALFSNPIYCTSKQGSQEWLDERAGVISASMAQTILSKLQNGSYSAAAKKYAFRLALERIENRSLDDEGFEVPSAKRGRFLEPHARAKHESVIGVFIDECGFVKTQCGRFGGSPDGLIRDDGGAEYKCFTAIEKVMPILLEGKDDDAYAQMQMSMLMTGREWWHLGFYCPSLGENRELTILFAERDDDFIANLILELLAFDRYVDHLKIKLLSTNFNNPFVPAVKKMLAKITQGARHEH